MGESMTTKPTVALCTHAVTGRAASIAWFCVSVWFGLCMVADVWVEWKKGKSE